MARCLHWGWPVVMAGLGRRLAGATAVVALLGLVGCGNRAPVNPVIANGAPSVVVMDFSQALPLHPLPPGWVQRTFFRTPPMDMRFVDKDGRPAIRLATDHSASMLFRDTDIAVNDYPTLAWGWFVETPIDSPIDETTAAGDDHPARIYLQFLAGNGDKHALEIIWGDSKLHAGDWKYLKSWWQRTRFPHYVARGGDENVGRWFDERVDLRELYRKQWGDPAGVRLKEVALFADTDDTGGKSVAYFSTLKLLRAPAR